MSSLSIQPSIVKFCVQNPREEHQDAGLHFCQSVFHWSSLLKSAGEVPGAGPHRSALQYSLFPQQHFETKQKKITFDIPNKTTFQQ